MEKLAGIRKYNLILALVSAVLVGCSNAARDSLENGKTAYRDKQYESAHNSLSTATQQDPSLEEAYYYLGSLYRDWKGEEVFEGKTGYELAIAAYTKAIQIKDDYTLAYQNRGDIYERQGKLEEAAADYKKLIQLNPDSNPAYEGLSNIYKQHYEKTGKVEYLTEAEKSIDKAIERNRENIDLYRKRASINLLYKDYKGAIEDYTQIIDLSMKKGKENIDYRAMLERGKVYLELKEYEKAYQDFNKSYEVFQTPEVSDLRKKALRERDKAKKAGGPKPEEKTN